jgi:hypothetical protein
VLGGWSLEFVRAPQRAPHHLAIRLAPETFTDAIERLPGRGIAFGNDPEDATNGRTDDPLGGAGRPGAGKRYRPSSGRGHLLT